MFDILSLVLDCHDKIVYAAFFLFFDKFSLIFPENLKTENRNFEHPCWEFSVVPQ